MAGSPLSERTESSERTSTRAVCGLAEDDMRNEPILSGLVLFYRDWTIEKFLGFPFPLGFR